MIIECSASKLPLNAFQLEPLTRASRTHSIEGPDIWKATTDFETKRHHLKCLNRFEMQSHHMLMSEIVDRSLWTAIVHVRILVLHKSNLLYQAKVDLNDLGWIAIKYLICDHQGR